MVINPGGSGVVIGYQVDAYSYIWSTEQMVTHSHIYPGLQVRFHCLPIFCLNQSVRIIHL